MGVTDGGYPSEEAPREQFNPKSTVAGCPECGYPARSGINQCPQCGHSFVTEENNPAGAEVSSSARVVEPKKKEPVFKGGGTVIRSSGTANSAADVTGRKIVGILVTYSRLSTGEIFHVYEGRNYVGRNESVDIQVQDDAGVSDKHFSILYRAADGKFKFRDEQSSNGTYVNDELIDEGELHHADVISIGSTRLIFMDIPSIN
jgi:hypothetical protein